MSAVRYAYPARTLHEPVLVPLPALPTSTAQATGVRTRHLPLATPRHAGPREVPEVMHAPHCRGDPGSRGRTGCPVRRPTNPTRPTSSMPVQWRCFAPLSPSVPRPNAAWAMLFVPPCRWLPRSAISSYVGTTGEAARQRYGARVA